MLAESFRQEKRPRPAEVSEQLLEAALRVGHVAEHLADDVPPAPPLALLAGPQSAGQVEGLLAREGSAESPRDLGDGEPAAERLRHGGINGGGGRLRMNERADRVEDDGTDVRRHHMAFP